MSTGLDPSAWHNLFLGVLSASTALLGLFVVALSLRLREFEHLTLVRHRTQISLAGLVVASTIGVAVLLPAQPLVWLGIEIIASYGIYMILLAIWTVGLMRIGERPRFAASVRLTASIPIVALGIAAGVSLIIKAGPGLYILIPGLFVLVPISTYNIWDIIFAPELNQRGERS